MSYQLTEEEVQNVYNVFGCLMLAEYEDGNCPFPFTMEDEYGNIYTLTIDVKLDTPQ